MTLGQRIQQIRIEHGLSQEEFAEKLEYFMSDKSDRALFFEVFCD